MTWVSERLKLSHPDRIRREMRVLHEIRRNASQEAALLNEFSDPESKRLRFRRQPSKVHMRGKVTFS